MKTALVLLVLTLAVLAVGNVAQASATNWMLYLVTDSTNDEDFGLMGQIGVKPAGADNWDTYDGIPIDFSTTGSATKWAGFPLTGGTTSPDLYSKNFMSTASYTTYPSWIKKWAFRVGGLSASSGPIRLQFKTGTSTATLAPTAPSAGWYYIKLVSNKGNPVVRPAWAPGAGTPWIEGEMFELTIPTTTSTYFGTMVLPELEVSPNDNPSFMNQGYQFEIRLGAIPEPSGLLALGAGLAGFMGLLRRHGRRC